MTTLASEELEPQRIRIKRVRSVRFTDQEWHLVKARASQLGVPVSEVVRGAVLEALLNLPELVLSQVKEEPS